jgi:hypothetical protein
MTKSILFLSLAFSSLALANPENSLSTSYNYQKPTKSFSLMLEGDSVILGGAGIKASYKVSPKISVGALAKVYKIKSDQKWESDNANSYENKMTLVGITGGYFLTGNYDEQGPYVTAGVTSASVETSVNDSYFGKGTSTASKIGSEAKLGYQFVNLINPGLGMVFQVGLGYGNGGQLRWNAATGQNAVIGDSLLLDLSAGLQF